MRQTKNSGNSDKSLPLLRSHAAGIDVGADTHYVCVPPGRAESSVRSFKCYTPDLHKMAHWLRECGVNTIAMESTGVYWIPVFQILDSHGFEVLLVNARHVRNVPGRKTDVQDCQWLQQLHSYGLLRGSFRPENEMCVLRSYVRQRANSIRSASSHIQRMQKTLVQMNLQLHRAISDITGVTGTRIIEAIIAGVHDPKQLAQLKNQHIQCSEKALIDALTGDYRKEHLFVLKQEYEFYQFYQQKIADCDKEIEKHYHIMTAADLDSIQKAGIPKPQRKRKNKNAPHFNLHQQLFLLAGVDFTNVPGLDVISIQNILSEVGLDPHKWRTEKHFTSWLGVMSGKQNFG